MLFSYTDKDTDNDGAINMNDLKRLGIYSFGKRELRTIACENQSVEAYSFIEGSKDLLIVMGVDKNKDGRYQEDTEYSLVMRHNGRTGELSDAVPQTVRNSLQNLVEGRAAEPE